MSNADDKPQQLSELRRQIDALDDKLIELMSERGRLASRIGKLKATDGSPIYAPDREKEIFERLRAANQGPFPDTVIRAVYRELMSGSFALERPLRIAYLGPRGSFSHLAAVGKFGASVEYEPLEDIHAAFAEVERGHADLAVVPVENSTGGGVIDTLDAFINSQARICAEINRIIHHNLLSRVPLERIERLYSKPEIFTQCRNWLIETGMLSKTVAVASSSKAAELASAELNTAAIGSVLAAEINDLPVLFANIEDNPNNVTRFFIIGRDTAQKTGDDKTAIMFATPHRAGALVDVLEIFRADNINLTMITSRPSKKRNWEYYFFVDAEGHLDDPAMARAIKAASEFCLHFSVLGSFPRAADVD